VFRIVGIDELDPFSREVEWNLGRHNGQALGHASSLRDNVTGRRLDPAQRGSSLSAEALASRCECDAIRADL
jgi:hypothetical protein